MKSTLDAAIERFYADSPLVRIARAQGVPEEVIHALFSNGFAMGSLHGFSEARDTFETTLMDYASGRRITH